MKLTGDFAKLADLQKRLARIPTPETRTELARVVGEAARTQLTLGFRNSVDPYGVPWLPLKHRRGKPLLDTGRLRSSYTYTPSPTGVRIGTNVQYAKFHQYGTNGLRKAYSRNQAVKDNLFWSHAKAGKQKRGAVSFRRLNYAAGSGKIPARMMLPIKERGLGKWQEPMVQAAKRFIVRQLRG
jgi:phage gpG-like protein